jgi:Ser/Thr protein kinase RdoA (MazF antagonist)
MNIEKLDKSFEWIRPPKETDLVLDRVPSDFLGGYIAIDKEGERIGRQIAPHLYGFRRKESAKGPWSYIAIEKVNGPRLDNYLKKKLSAATENEMDSFYEIYQALGENVARLCSLDLAHHDLFLGNIVVGSDGPVIIDWETLGSGGYAIAIQSDLTKILKDTWSVLDGLGCAELTLPLSKIFDDAYHSTYCNYCLGNGENQIQA